MPRRSRKEAAPKPPPKTHSHATCIVCGHRLSKQWAKNAKGRSARWGYELVGGGRVKGSRRKLRDLFVTQYTPDQIRAWLPGTAEDLAARVTLAVADLLRAGWSLEELRVLADQMSKRGFLTRVVDYVLAAQPRIQAKESDRAKVIPGGSIRPPMSPFEEVRAKVLDDDGDDVRPPMNPFGASQ